MRQTGPRAPFFIFSMVSLAQSATGMPTESMYPMPQRHMSAIIGISDSPRGVSAYSVLGGTSG